MIFKVLIDLFVKSLVNTILLHNNIVPTQPRLLMHKNFKEIPKDWLELEILRLVSYPVIFDTFNLYDTSKERRAYASLW